MKNCKRFIIGILTIVAIILPNHAVQAGDICNPNNIDTSYKDIYCSIRMDSNETADDEIVEILATQFDMDEDLIKEILANTICETVSKYDEDDIADLPESIKIPCLISEKTAKQALGSWNLFSDIRNAYGKEKIIRQNRASLEFKFKVSEQYWDGQIGTVTWDAPFDLIVDLNLIEIVLFGSKATWMNDVYSFPADEEGDGGGGSDIPLDELLPEDEEKVEDEGFEDTEDPGIAVTEGEEGVPPGCVLPDDPEADLGDGPGSSYNNPLCGNGAIDILVGEQCDDGNSKSGDGCNQYCQTEASGSSDQCADPEAITFKRPESKVSDDVIDDVECPEGMFPKSGAGFKGEEAGPPQEVPQNPEYPGPFLGGTLKQFPASNRPTCGPGKSAIEATAAGETGTVTDEDDEPICIPTEYCASFDDARTFLAVSSLSVPDGDWQSLSDDDPRKQTLEAIELLFCVNITKENRPQSPYETVEGCIDCHITAMVDALEKALETNVTPLKNTTAAFGTSSPYGTKFSFNLNTAFKAKLKYQTSTTAKNRIADENEKVAASDRKHTPVPNTLKGIQAGTPLKTLANKAIKNKVKRAKTMEDTRINQLSNQVISDQEVSGRINPLLGQMRDSFAQIQSLFQGMIETKLNEKNKCE